MNKLSSTYGYTAISELENNSNANTTASPQAQRIQDSFLKVSKEWSEKILNDQSYTVTITRQAEFVQGEVVFGYGKVKASSNNVKFYTLDAFFNKKKQSVTNYSNVKEQVRKDVTERYQAKKGNIDDSMFKNMFSDTMGRKLIEQMSFQITASLASDAKVIGKFNPNPDVILEDQNIISQRVIKLTLNILKADEMSNESKKGLELAIDKLNEQLKVTSAELQFASISPLKRTN